MIVFEKITYQNFLSVGSAGITLDLNTHRTTLLNGKNGSGKSTFLSAICFVLYGRAYTDINKNQLINSINQKKLLVELDFSIGKKKYKIKRGIKPNIFEIYDDGKLVNPPADSRDYQRQLEQQILKMNFRMFTQIVIMSASSSYTPFMRLRQNERREFIEDLLDIRIFTFMNKLLKEKRDSISLEIKDMTRESISIKEKIKLQESFIKKLRDDKGATLTKLHDDILLLESQNNSINDSINSLISKADKMNSICKHDSILESISELRVNMKLIGDEKNRHIDQKNKYSTIDVCPTCTQRVEEHLKSKVIAEYDVKIDEHESELDNLKQSLDGLLEKLKNHSRLNDEIESLNHKISELNKERQSNLTLITRTQQQIRTLEGDTSSVDEEISKQKEFAKQFMVLEEKKRDCSERLQYSEFVNTLLQDNGIKSKIIAKYIPTINKLVNTYLASFDFFVLFELSENFEESIKSRHRDLFTYSSFSEGQKLRIDVALLLAWREIAKQKNSVYTNILLLDEIDSPLDAEGSGMLTDLLRSTNIQNLFVISHKDISDKFDRTVTFSIKNNYTEMDIV